MSCIAWNMQWDFQRHMQWSHPNVLLLCISEYGERPHQVVLKCSQISQGSPTVNSPIFPPNFFGKNIGNLAGARKWNAHLISRRYWQVSDLPSPWHYPPHSTLLPSYFLSVYDKEGEERSIPLSSERPEYKILRMWLKMSVMALRQKISLLRLFNKS